MKGNPMNPIHQLERDGANRANRSPFSSAQLRALPSTYFAYRSGNGAWGIRNGSNQVKETAPTAITATELTALLAELDAQDESTVTPTRHYSVVAEHDYNGATDSE